METLKHNGSRADGVPTTGSNNGRRADEVRAQPKSSEDIIFYWQLHLLLLLLKPQLLPVKTGASVLCRQ